MKEIIAVPTAPPEQRLRMKLMIASKMMIPQRMIQGLALVGSLQFLTPKIPVTNSRAAPIKLRIDAIIRIAPAIGKNAAAAIEVMRAMIATITEIPPKTIIKIPVTLSNPFPLASILKLLSYK